MIYACKKCGYVFWAKRARCPKCGSVEFDIVNENLGDLIVFWKLNATPEGFENSYYLCLVKIMGSNAFCRSLEEPKSSRVILNDDGTCKSY